MKEVRVALGAELGDPDVFEFEAGVEELALIGGSEVDAGLTFESEVGRDFGADFKAAETDAGADGGVETGGFGTQGGHFEYGAGRDFSDGAAPAGMDGGDDAGSGVDDENGETIGGTDGEPELGSGGDQGIGFALEARAASAEHFRRVGLFEPGVVGIVKPRAIFTGTETMFDVGEFLEARRVDHPS